MCHLFMIQLLIIVGIGNTMIHKKCFKCFHCCRPMCVFRSTGSTDVLQEEEKIIAYNYVGSI